MNSNNKLLAACAVLAGLALFSTASNAAGLYLGGGAGITNFSDDIEVEDVGDIDLDDDDTMFKLFGGYRFHPNFAVEGGYRDFGEVGDGPFSVETTGWDVSALGIAPIGPVELFAKGGVIFWDTDGNGGIPDESSEDLLYGVGVALNLVGVFFRLESEWYDIDFPDDIQTISLSVGFGF